MRPNRNLQSGDDYMNLYNSDRALVLFVFFICLFCFFKKELSANEARSKIAFHISDPRDSFQFESEAPLEKIIGTTNNIIGEIILQPNNVVEDLQASFEIDLATIKTGIKERDKHLREKYLETRKYPKAILTIDRIIQVESDERDTPEKLEDNKSAYVTARGILKLHGIEKMITVRKVKITYFKGRKELEAINMYGDILKIDAKFKLKLSDYNIKRPQLFFMKLSNELELSISILASTKPLGLFWGS